jgi:hypothetical protein
MTYQIASRTFYRRTVHYTFDSYQEAETFAKSRYNIFDYTKDESQDYDCADFYTSNGEVYQIEPAR